MRFKEYLKESEMTLDDLLKEMVGKSKRFMLNPTKKALLRGLKDPSAGFFSQPKNRPPSASPASLVFALDAGIKQAYGIDRVRETSVFVTGSPTQAEDYGLPTFYIPAGDFTSVWSPKIFDAYAKDSEIFDSIATGMGFSTPKSDDITAPRALSVIATVFRTVDRHIDVDAFLSGSDEAASIVEDAFEQAHRLLDLPTPSNIDHLYFDLLKALKKVFLEMYVVGDIDNAIASRNEIMMQGDGYFVVPFYMVQVAMAKDNHPHAEYWDVETAWEYLKKKMHEAAT